MTKKRIRHLIDLERTELGEQHHVVWFEEKEIDDENDVVEETKSK